MKKLLALLLLLPTFSFAEVGTFNCSNADVDSLETVCNVQLNKKYSECSYAFTVGTAVLSDFDIAVGTGAGSVTEYTASGDYTTPEGFLYYASRDMTNAPTTGTHVLVLDHLSTIETLTFSAAGTNSVVTGTVTCNAL